MFSSAGLCEIGGGYLVRFWLREGKSIWFAPMGAVVPILYGIIPIFHLFDPESTIDQLKN
ncbi:MAG TPA: hypothetical protein ENH07_04500 [Nitrospirae bacterium]|nr:hypothetical protein [Nitrospirota bacterium]HDO35537.1 hypothetical protein [Nitrospirota bacterium]HDZ87232.1 hypothetical protein [Nitrospirota bacterium]